MCVMHVDACQSIRNGSDLTVTCCMSCFPLRVYYCCVCLTFVVSYHLSWLCCDYLDRCCLATSSGWRNILHVRLSNGPCPGMLPLSMCHISLKHSGVFTTVKLGYNDARGGKPKCSYFRPVTISDLITSDPTCTQHAHNMHTTCTSNCSHTHPHTTCIYTVLSSVDATLTTREH